jgi:hypothetical protein
MGKKSSKKKTHKLERQNTAASEEIIEFPPKVEKISKIILRTMSWIVGSAFLAIIVLPYFKEPSIDYITKIIFRIGIVTLIIFLVIELTDKTNHKLKKWINRFI